MKKVYVCDVCGYEYDGDVPFEQLPDDWTCPLCGVGKDQFSVREEYTAERVGVRSPDLGGAGAHFFALWAGGTSRWSAKARRLTARL